MPRVSEKVRLLRQLERQIEYQKVRHALAEFNSRAEDDAYEHMKWLIKIRLWVLNQRYVQPRFRVLTLPGLELLHHLNDRHFKQQTRMTKLSFAKLVQLIKGKSGFVDCDF